jgi:hypothetical protein
MATMAAREIFKGPESNAKLAHGNDNWYVMSLSLAASDTGGQNVCSRAFPASEAEAMLADGVSIEQIAAYANAKGLSCCSLFCCVNRTGRGRMPNVEIARRSLSRWFEQDREGFLAAATAQLIAERRQADDEGYRLAIRPNCNSDKRWEVIAPHWFDIVETAYDYTKDSARLGKTPENYHLVYSVNDGTTFDDWRRVHDTGASIALAFDVEYQPGGKPEYRKYGVLPNEWTDPTGYRWEVIDADAIDARFLDVGRVCAGLRLKGTIEGRAQARACGFAETKFAGGMFTRIHPADARLAIL